MSAPVRDIRDVPPANRPGLESELRAQCERIRDRRDKLVTIADRLGSFAAKMMGPSPASPSSQASNVPPSCALSDLDMAVSGMGDPIEAIQQALDKLGA
jgi:hypothetical protein